MSLVRPRDHTGILKATHGTFRHGRYCIRFPNYEASVSVPFSNTLFILWYLLYYRSGFLFVFCLPIYQHLVLDFIHTSVHGVTQQQTLLDNVTTPAPFLHIHYPVAPGFPHKNGNNSVCWNTTPNITIYSHIFPS